MSSKPFFSICIPVYKNVEFLRRLLDSIFEQSFTNYEIVITDDSPDNTVGEWITKNYPAEKISYYKNPASLGTPENWNEAIRKANGEWIKLMHDDDWFCTAEALQIFYEQVSKSNASFVFSAFYNVYLEDKNLKRLVSLNQSRWKKVKRFPGNLYAKNIIGPPSVTAIKANLAKQQLYDASLKWLVDLDCYIRLMKEGEAIYINEPVVCIGVGSAQVTAYTHLNPQIEIPEGLALLAKLAPKAFDHILLYDAWWRLIRNLGIRDAASLDAYSAGKHVPPAIYKMIFWQRFFPPALLKMGAFSKILMFLSWLLH